MYYWQYPFPGASCLTVAGTPVEFPHHAPGSLAVFPVAFQARISGIQVPPLSVRVTGKAKLPVMLKAKDLVKAKLPVMPKVLVKTKVAPLVLVFRGWVRDLSLPEPRLQEVRKIPDILPALR